MPRRVERRPVRDAYPPSDRASIGGSPAAPSQRQRERAPEAQADDRGTTVSRWALLPLRLFLGATFLYAGIDKLIDPAFLRATGPGSIGEQLQTFERVSPIAALVHLADPIPVLVGFLIALAEIAIGLGTILGLVFRVAAVGGAALALTFYLTASWDTTPYYFGPDLPYLAGWITLALAGHGDLYALGSWLAQRDEEARAAAALERSAWRRDPRGAGRAGRPLTEPSLTDPERRAFLQLGVLAIATSAVAILAGIWPFRDVSAAHGDLTGGTSAPSSAPDPTLTAGGGATPRPSATGASATPPAGATQIGDLATLKRRTAIAFDVPATGDPGVLVELPDGTVGCYDAVCTHEGCTVEYAPSAGVLFCPCHGAEFDPARGGAVLQGPARRPLPKLPITIDTATGKIYLTG